LCLPGYAAESGSNAATAESAAKAKASRPAYEATTLQGDERILHALNRFTFGPRTGDLAAVKKMGLEQWFDEQLHPAKIDETELTARLSDFYAMQLGPQELLYRLPSNALIRQAADGKVPVPEQGVLRAIWQNDLYRVQLKKEEKADKAAASAPGAAGTQMSSAQMSGPQTSGPQTAGQATANSNVAPIPDAKTMVLAKKLDVLDDATPEAQLYQGLLAMEPQQRLNKLASLKPAEFDGLSKSLKPAQKQKLIADMTAQEKEVAAALENPQRLVNEELLAQRLTRDIYSNAQLQEVMTDFWLNHFNIYLQKDAQMPYYLVSYERDVIRPLALGKFEDLLEAVAHSPAMMLYLDNAQSIGPDSPAAERAKMAAERSGKEKKANEGLNENYGRELMELHTLGVNGGYTQADVTEVARVLTGWGVDEPVRGGGFQFNVNRHEPGAKTVLGEKIKEGGELEGRELLHLLASRPATAEFISKKLAMRFVNDDPPHALVDRMAKAYMASGGDIPTVLKVLFHSPEFWAASDKRAKVKTPLEFVVSAVRASNADVSNFQPLIQALRQMGMPLYGCIPPTGYYWDEATWVSTGALVDRMNFALSLAGNKLQGVQVSWAPATTDGSDAAAPNPEFEEAWLEPLLVPGGVSVATRSAALQQFQTQMAEAASSAASAPANATAKPVAAKANKVGNGVSKTELEDEVLAGLLLGSPEFQRR
jgi:uncharacterized protein (DUF1800 family)